LVTNHEYGAVPLLVRLSLRKNERNSRIASMFLIFLGEELNGRSTEFLALESDHTTVICGEAVQLRVVK